MLEGRVSHATYYSREKHVRLETFRSETGGLKKAVPPMRTPMPEREMPGGRNASCNRTLNLDGRGHAAGRHLHGRLNMAVANTKKKTKFAGRACPHQSSASTDKLTFGCGPALLNSPASKKKNISEIVRGEIRWCQASRARCRL